MENVQLGMEGFQEDQLKTEQNMESIRENLQNVEQDLEDLENQPPIVVNGTFYALEDTKPGLQKIISNGLVKMILVQREQISTSELVGNA